jgi:hypothetical protein
MSAIEDTMHALGLRQTAALYLKAFERKGNIRDEGR